MTEDSSSDGPDNVEIKIAAYNGGSKAEAWLDVLMNKLSDQQEEMLELMKQGTLEPEQLPKKTRRSDQDLYNAILDSLIHKNATPEPQGDCLHTQDDIRNRGDSYDECDGRAHATPCTR